MGNFRAVFNAAYNGAKKSKYALKRFLNRTRGRVRRGGGDKESDGASSNVPGKGFPWRRLAPLALSLLVSWAVFALLRTCESKAYDIPPFSPSRCETLTQDLGFMSISGGVGFLALLSMEVMMIFAQMWSDKQVEAAERRAQIAERRAEIAEQARREEAERAERREQRLIELIKSFKKDEDLKDEDAV